MNTFLLPDDIFDLIGQLSTSQCVVFAACCCERMLPDYIAYSAQSHWGESAILREGLDYIWHYILSGTPDRSEATALRERCMAVAPDAEDFPGPIVSYALNAAAGVCETLDLCLDGERTHALWVASLVRDTLDFAIRDELETMEVIEVSTPEIEAKIAHHELMRAEFSRQRVDLHDLAAATDLTAPLVNELRTRASLVQLHGRTAS